MTEAAEVSKTDDKKAEKPPVDNATLAFMLRESADIVEKGEFDVILYHALQDFRTYYKLHLPKRKEKAKKKTATTTASTTDAPASAENTSTDVAANATGEAAETSNPTAAASAAKADPPAQATSTEQSKPETPAREISAGTTVVSEGTASTTISSADVPASTSRLNDDAPESAEPSAERAASENQIDSETGRMGSVDSILDSGRTGEEFANESSSSLPNSHDKKFTSPFGKKAKNTGRITAGMFGANKMKLPKKLPKIHVNLPTSIKKKREAELADVTGGNVAQYAESSSRRRAAAGDEYDIDHNYQYEADTQSPQRSTNLQPAVTGLAAGNNAEIPPTSATTPVDRVRENEPADTEKEKPSSLRNNDNTHNAATNTASEADPAAPTPSVPSPPAASEAFVADPRPESFDQEMFDEGHSKPSFQRPKNKNSAVVANGWIEQQRRSKMRTVWKEVLASLVQGKRPGEETTLWIQRETVDAVSGKKELEALHQIPVKLLEGVVYSEFTTDDRFSLKLYNSQEEFVFRCNNDPSATMNWVTILQQHEMETKKNGNFQMPPPESAFPGITEEKKGADIHERSSSPNPSRLAIRDLRAICHGAGINTAGMERADLERAAAEVKSRGTFFAPPSAGHPAAGSISTGPPAASGAGSNPTSRSSSPLPPRLAEPSAPASNGATATRMSIKDLRAICHGAGISTVGMERGELERAAADVQKRGTYFAPPGSAPPPGQYTVPDVKPEDDAAARQEEMRRRQAAEDEARRRAAEEEHWRRHEEETRRRAAEDEHRRRAEEEHRRRAAEEEHRRRMAEQQARQAEEQRRRYAEQQAAWQHQQHQEEQRRRMAEEQRRRHEEAMRKQQQWAGQQPQHHQQQGWSQPPPQHSHHQKQHYQHPPQQPHAQHHQQQWQQQQQQWHHQQHYQQHQARPQGPPPQQQHAPPPQQHPPQQQSKYAKMANQTDDDDDGQAAITKLKHDILIQWALQPPQLQMLRSVDVLLSTIQNVFPPALGVPAHDYFRKWKAVTRESVLSDAGIIDEEKVKKAVRKLRFFLHPDKLPKDLNKEQEFMVKMLWDITNDAWEEYQKSKEDLDWVK